MNTPTIQTRLADQVKAIHKPEEREWRTMEGMPDFENKEQAEQWIKDNGPTLGAHGYIFQIVEEE